MRLREYCGTSVDKTLSSLLPQSSSLIFRVIGSFPSANSSTTSSSKSSPSSVAIGSAANAFATLGGVVRDISYNLSIEIFVSLHPLKLLIRHAKNLIEVAYCRIRPFLVGMRLAAGTKRRDSWLVCVQIILGSEGRTDRRWLREGNQVL